MRNTAGSMGHSNWHFHEAPAEHWSSAVPTPDYGHLLREAALMTPFRILFLAFCILILSITAGIQHTMVQLNDV